MKCYACDQALTRPRARIVFMEDDDQGAQFVGGDCFRSIAAQGATGFQPAQGPRLFAFVEDARAYASRKHHGEA